MPHDRIPHDRIHSDPRIMTGKPVTRGTRVTVEHVLRSLVAGDTPEQVRRTIRR